MSKTDSQIAKAFGFKPISEWHEKETNYADPYLLRDITDQRDKAQAQADKLAEALRDLCNVAGVHDAKNWNKARKTLAEYESEVQHV